MFLLLPFAGTTTTATATTTATTEPPQPLYFPFDEPIPNFHVKK